HLSLSSSSGISPRRRRRGRTPPLPPQGPWLVGPFGTSYAFSVRELLVRHVVLEGFLSLSRRSRRKRIRRCRDLRIQCVHPVLVLHIRCRPERHQHDLVLE